MADLKGKVGIVTGGGSGIGKATALAMARAGAALVIGNRDAAKGEEVVGLIRHAGGRAVFQKTDVSKPGDVRGLVERAVKEFGRLDLAFTRYGSHRCWTANLLTNLGIRSGAAWRNRLQRLPDPLLEGRALDVQRQIEATLGCLDELQNLCSACRKTNTTND